MKKKIRFIINPVSGNGRNIQIRDIIHKYIDKDQFDYEISFTEYAGHATQLSKEAAEKEYFAVIAVGGDGSVNEAGRGILYSNTALGIVPRGSGNGLALHLKIPIVASEAVRRINKANVTSIDSLSLNDELCMGIAGLGFDAHVAHQFAKAGKRGLSTYLKVILREYNLFPASAVEFEIEGKTFSKEAFLLTFANSSQYGNMAQIAPMADIQDGEMEICILKKVPVLKTPFFAFRLFTRSSQRSSFLEIIKAKEVTIKQWIGDHLHIDGEPVFMHLPLKVKVNPLSIKVIV